MDGFSKVTSFTRVFVYDNYEFITLNNSESIFRAFERFKDFIDQTGPINNKYTYERENLIAHIEETALGYFNYLRSNPNKTLILPTKDALLNINKNDFKARLYTPLDEGYEQIQLHTELAKVHDNKTLEKFVSIFGIPDGEKGIPLLDYIKSFTLYDMHFEFADVDKLLDNISRYREIFCLWEAIKTHDYEFLLKAEKNHQNVFENFEAFFKLKIPSNLIERAQYILISLLEFALEENNSTGRVINGKIRPVIFFTNLIYAAYYQLRLAVFNDVSMKKCEYCGQLFEVTHEGRRFCPPHPGKKRSTCENNFNQRLKRKRKKERDIERGD